MAGSPVCVVAGVGPGIGLAVAERAAREGCTAILLARRAAAVEAHAERLRASGLAAFGYGVDLVDLAAMRDVFARIVADHGDPGLLVYNAALWREAPPLELAAADFAADLALCVTGAFAFAQLVFPAMAAARRGSILFTGGGLALRPEFGGKVASLTAGKAALRALTYALAGEFAPAGIHVATVTVAGTVAQGTAFDPDRIAERFWQLHAEPAGHWTTETVFDGT